LLAAVVLLAACSSPERTPAAAYRHFWDRALVATGLAGGRFGLPCMERVHDATGDYDTFIGNEACYRFMPARRMQGIWISEFEGSIFLPGATSSKVEPDALSRIWLEPHTPPPAPFKRDGESHVYRIEFVGRESLYPGSYGHMGMSRDLVLVERFLKLSEIEQAPRPRP
jgi:hypothetical protein